MPGRDPTNGFDPYSCWFGIPKKEQPPDHYRLLGIARFESDRNQILAAYRERMKILRSHLVGPHSRAAQRLLKQLLHAAKLLRNDQARAEYNFLLEKEALPIESVNAESPIPQGTALSCETMSRPVLRRYRSRKSALRQITEVVVGGVGGIVVAILLLHFGFDQDPFGIFARPRQAKSPRLVLPTALRQGENAERHLPVLTPTSRDRKTESPSSTLLNDLSGRSSPEPAPLIQADPAPSSASLAAASTPPSPTAESLIVTQDMPPPFISENAKWFFDGEELVTEGIGRKTQLFLFGNPAWDEYDLKIEVIEDMKRSDGKKPLENQIIFLADAEGKNHWLLNVGAFGGSRNFDLLPCVAGENPWRNKARRWIPNRLHGETGVWYRVEVQVRQQRVTVVIDGETIATSQHSSLAKGRVGVGSFGTGRARWRNCEVRAIDGRLLWKGWPPLPISEQPAVAERQTETSTKHVLAATKPTIVLPETNRELDQYSVGLKESLGRYERQVAEAREAMLMKFDAAISKVRAEKKRLASERTVMIRRLETERMAFDKAGYLPFSLPMREAWEFYLERRGRAQETLRGAFDREIADKRRAKLKEAALALEQERDRRLNRFVVAKWSGRMDWIFYSDGTASSEEGGGPWERNGEWVTFQSPQRGNGTVIITCQLSIMGDRLEGLHPVHGFKFESYWVPP